MTKIEKIEAQKNEELDKMFRKMDYLLQFELGLQPVVADMAATQIVASVLPVGLEA